MKKSQIKNFLFALIALFSFTVLFNSCDSWMSDDDSFYSEIEEEVKRANATQIQVYVRYAATKMGKTNPDGYSTFKVNIPSEISATTETDYGFKRWAAFSTNNFKPGDTQYTNFVYENDEAYQENYGKLELSSDIVKFSDPTSSSTSVTVFEDRNDIYIIPVVAKRPTIALTMPGSGSSGIVRNMTVRINFSKPMDPASFFDGNGVLDKITVTEGTQSITSDGDIEISSNEITDFFAEPTFSTNGKMLTMKFNAEHIAEGYSAQSYVTFNLSKDVKDIYGYSMADDYKLQFQVGSSFDTLAPRIATLTGGIGKAFDTFGGIYKDDDTSLNLGSYTTLTLDGAKNADSNIDNPLYTELQLAQRVKDKLNIRIVAEDIAGSGSSQDQTGVESEVSMIGVRAANLISMDGTPAAADSVIPIRALAYVPQTNQSEITGGYREITGSTKGYLFTYDLSTLPDGLIKIDVCAYDSIGNSGLLDGGNYSAEYGNGYASIFVVKDTTAPDAAANAAKIISYSSDAPYRWYSAKTLNTMKIYQESAGAIVDAGHEKLRSKAENLQWYYKVTDQTDWAADVAQNAAEWKLVKDGYSINNASIPTKEGPVAISYIIKDDLGNVSDAVSLSSIMYDNTPAIVQTPTWVKADGTLALNASVTPVVTNSILKIPYTDNLSKIKRIEVNITNRANSAAVASPIAESKYKYAQADSTAPANVNEITIATEDSANSNNKAVFTDSLENGYLFITDLTIGDADGIYDVAVNLYDNALNKSETKSTTISRDTTAPEIKDSTIAVNEIISSTSYEGTTKYWLKKEAFDESRTANKVSLSFTVKETGSGIREIRLPAGTVYLTENTVLKVGDAVLIRGNDSATSDYKLDVAANTITLYDSYNPKIFGNEVLVTLENVRFSVVNSTSANVAKIIIKDFVENESIEAKSVEVYADTADSEVQEVKVSDISSSSIYYTNDLKVNLQIKMEDKATESSAGIKEITLTNVRLTNSSVIKVAGTGSDTILIKDTQYRVGPTGSIITLEKPFDSAVTLKLENIEITQAPETLGNKAISVQTKDFIGWTSAVISANNICYDNVAPTSEQLYWTAPSGVVPGYAKDNVLNNQLLHIPFVESPAGINKLTLKVTKQGGAEYGTPLDNPAIPGVTPGLIVKYTPAAGTPVVLTAGTDYTISESKKEIIFTSPKTTGEIEITGLKVDNTPIEGVTVIEVKLEDIAENCDVALNKSITIENDKTAPVVEKIEIPGLKKSSELTAGVTAKGPDGWWLDHEYVGGNHNDNYAATQVPLYVTINEKTSGVNLITLGGTMQLQANSTLWMVAEDGTETAVEASKYTVNTTANTITINNPSDSLKNASGKDNFVILIKDLKATGIGGDSYAANTVSLTVKDVALNESAANTTITKKGENTTVTEFYTDSWASGLAGVVIVDRNASLIKATDGYTNESIVDVYVHASAENKGYSGHNKFKLTGGKFTTDSKIYIGMNETSSTNALTAVTSATDELSSDKYVISDDKTTIELRNADSSEYYVIRNHLALKFTNIQLDDATTDGEKAISCQPYDLVGWEETAAAKTGTVIFDKTEPEIRRPDDTEGHGLYVYNNTTSSRVSTLANPGKFVFPHGGTTEGFIIDANEKNGDGKQVHYFYVSAKSTINTSSSSYASTHPIYGTTANPSGNVYGVALGIGNHDNIGVKNSEAGTAVGYYIYKHGTTDVTSTLTAEKILKKQGTTGTLWSPEDIGKDIGNAAAKANSSSDLFNRQWFPLYGQDSVTYSVILADQAGNYSKADTFTVVKDVKQPSLTYDSSAYISGGNKSLGNLVWIETEGNVFRNTKRANHEVKSNSTTNSTYEMGANDFDYSSVWTYDYVVKQGKHEITINLGQAVADKTQLDGTSKTPNANYSESQATKTSSPLEMYAISHRYRQWSDNADDDSTNPFIPAFPVGTVSPDGKDLFDLFGYEGETKPTTKNHQFTSNVLWREYKKGVSYTDDKISHKVDDDGNIVITLPTNTLDACPPLTLLLKDGTGNLNFLHIKPVSMEDSGCKTVSWVIDDMVSTDVEYTTKTASRHIGMVPYMKDGDKIDAYKLDGTSAGSKAWGNRTSPYQFNDSDPEKRADGETAIGVQARDLKGRVTYYNDKAYIALFNKAETCKYNKRTVKNADDGNGYTLRAVIRAWNSTGDAPTQDDFINSDGTSITGEDFSNWIYLRDVATNTNNDYVLQYPHPSRTSKFRLYYYVEDAVGNYEINTIVNDNKDDGDAGQMIYWMYDNAGPSVLTRKNNLSPKDIKGDNIGELVATNNGFRPYYNAGTGYIVETTTLRSGHSLPAATSLGEGILLGCIGGENTKYGSYFDLNITETSGIRAFAYTTNPSHPDIPTASDDNYGTASMGDAGNWYAGKTTCAGGTGMLATREIGSTFTTYPYYPASTGKYLYSNAGDTTYDYYDSSYGKDIYSGVKVVATIPYGVINETSSDPEDLYLHVMDWVGNITTVKLGNGIKWVNDRSNTAYKSSSETYSVDNEYYIAESSTPSLTYTFALTKDVLKNATSYKVYYPDFKYIESSEANTAAKSGMFGWSRDEYDVSKVLVETTGPHAGKSYIELTSTELDSIRNGTPVTLQLYIYDNVGWCNPVNITFIGDSEPNEFTIFVRPGDRNKLFYVKDSSSAASSENQSTGSVSSGTEITSLNAITAKAYTNGTKVTYLAQFKDKKPASDLRTLSIDRYEGSETYDAAEWNNVQKWEIGKTNTGWVYSDPHGDGYYYLDDSSAPVSTHSDYLYYRLVTQDKAGNENYAYIKIVQDKAAPTATIDSANITHVNFDGGINYYNSKSEATVTVSDEGSGVKSYGGFNVDGYRNTVDTSVILRSISTVTSSHSMPLNVLDNLDNQAQASITYNSSGSWIYDNTKPDIEKVSLKTDITDTYKYQNGSVTSSTSNTNFVITTPESTTSKYSYSTIKITSNSSSDAGKHINVSLANVSKFKFVIPNTETADTNYYGFIHTATPLASDYWAAISDVTAGSEYEFDSIPTDKYYFYLVDKAGNVSSPIVLHFKQAIIPSITNIAPGTNFANSNQYYTIGSTVKLTVKNPGVSDITVTGVGITGSNNETDVISVSKTIAANTSEVIDVTLSKDFGTALDFDVRTDDATSQSNEFTASYDGTAPSDIKIDSVNDDSNSSAYVQKSGDGLTITYGSNASSIIITPSATDTQAGVAGYSSTENGDYTATVTFDCSRLPSTPTIWAKDNLGNKTSQAITIISDNTVSPIDDFTITGTGLYKSGTKLYYKGDVSSIGINVSVLDSDVAYYYYNNSDNKTTNGQFTITAADGDYTFKVVDKVGNESTGYTVTFVKDAEVPETATGIIKWYKVSTEVTDTSYVYYDSESGTYYYNANQINKFEFTPNALTDASGIVGFAKSNSATEWISSITVDSPTGEIPVYAKDNVGNVGKVATFKVAAVTAPKSTTAAGTAGYTGNSSMDSSIQAFKGHSIVDDSGTKVTLMTGNDNQHGDGYITKLYPAGSKLVLPITIGTPKVAYVIKGGNTSAACAAPDAYSEFTALTDGNLTVDMPSVADYHSFIFVFLKDQVGNVTAYNIGNPDNTNENWMCEYASIASSTPQATIVQNGTNYVLYLYDLSVQSPIKSIFLKGNYIAYKDFAINAYYENKSGSSNSVKFSAAYGTEASGNQYNPTFTFTKNNGSDAEYYIAGGRRIEITIPENSGNAVSVSEVVITDCNDNTVTIDSVSTDASDIPAFPSRYAGIYDIYDTASSVIKSLFTPNTKKVDLTAQKVIADALEAAGTVDVKRDSVQSASSAVVSEKAVAKKSRKAPARTKSLEARTSSAEVNSVLPQAVLPEGAKVLEASPITLGQTSAENINIEDSIRPIESYVESKEDPKHNVPLLMVIFTAVTAIVVAGILITNKKIIDKYN